MRDVVPPEVMERIGPLPPRDRALQAANGWQAFINEVSILHATTGTRPSNCVQRRVNPAGT